MGMQISLKVSEAEDRKLQRKTVKQEYRESRGGNSK